MPNPYAIAWNCLLVCLRNNYPLEIWISPIPDEHKPKMLEAAKRFLEKERLSQREPSLFNEEV